MYDDDDVYDVHMCEENVFDFLDFQLALSFFFFESINSFLYLI